METCTTSRGSLCCLVPVFILRLPADNPVLASPPNQEAVGRPVLQTQVKNWCLAQGSSGLHSLKWQWPGRILDNSREGKMSSFLFLNGEKRGEQLTDGIFWWNVPKMGFQALLFNLKLIFLTFLQGLFTLTLCWVSGAGLCPCPLLRQREHSVPQLISLTWRTPAISSWARTARTWGPKRAQLWQCPSATEQVLQVAPPGMPRAAFLGQRTQLGTAAAQHSADNQWRKEEMWQKWLEAIRSLTSGDLVPEVFFPVSLSTAYLPRRNEHVSCFCCFQSCEPGNSGS